MRAATRAWHRGLSTTTWRYERPLAVGAPLNVVFCGSKHFLAALPLTREALGDDAHVVIHQVQAADLRAALVGAQVVVPFMERLDASLLSVGEDIRLVMQFGVGVEGVDVEACTAKGIALSNCPAAASGNAASTAEHAVLLTMAMLRRGVDAWQRRVDGGVLGGLPLPRQLGSKRALVVGRGPVGSAIADRLIAFDAEVVRGTPHRAWRPSDGPRDARSVSRYGRAEILDALPSCDVVIFACPLTRETRSFVDDDFCACLKPGAVVVNVGRGPIVERDAILRALERDDDLSFASDVGVGDARRPSEPWDPTDALTVHPRTLFTPHVGGYTDVSYGRVSRLVADGIRAIQANRPPPNLLNELGGPRGSGADST